MVTFGVVRKISQGDPATEALAEQGPLSLFRIDHAGCETVANSLEIANVVVLTEAPQILELVRGLAGDGVCRHGGAEADAPIVQKENLVALVKDEASDGRVLRLWISEARPALQKDH